ncbi:hypothetical protein [Hyphomicrobium facile]|uniref:hypothetical protein n=1 Tax=Hyphomicrobium facile TaxID=51670 RepID=UPI001FCD0384|nr:hypothetical protein [Hyphomicrobium facile]
METVHNPDRFMGDLRQILSQGRKRIALLVGAGAPLAIKIGKDGQLSETGQALIPGVDELTRNAIAGLQGANLAAANAIIGDLGGKANIETVLTKVRLLEKALGKTKISGLDGNGYRLLGRANLQKHWRHRLRRSTDWTNRVFRARGLGERDASRPCGRDFYNQL